MKLPAFALLAVIAAAGSAQAAEPAPTEQAPVGAPRPASKPGPDPATVIRLTMIPVGAALVAGGVVALLHAAADKGGHLVRSFSGGLVSRAELAPVAGRRTRSAGAVLTVLRF